MKQDPGDRSHCDLSLVSVNGESHNRLLPKDNNNVISKAFDTMVKVTFLSLLFSILMHTKLINYLIDI